MDPIPIPTNLTVMTIDACCQRVQNLLESADLHYGHGASNAQSEALWIVSKQLEQSPSETLEQLELTISRELNQKALEIAKKTD